jgi:hypothetical protein
MLNVLMKHLADASKPFNFADSSMDELVLEAQAGFFNRAFALMLPKKTYASPKQQTRPRCSTYNTFSPLVASHPLAHPVRQNAQRAKSKKNQK